MSLLPLPRLHCPHCSPGSAVRCTSVANRCLRRFVRLPITLFPQAWQKPARPCAQIRFSITIAWGPKSAGKPVALPSALRTPHRQPLGAPVSRTSVAENSAVVLPSALRILHRQCPGAAAFQIGGNISAVPQWRQAAGAATSQIPSALSIAVPRQKVNSSERLVLPRNIRDNWWRP